MSSTTTSSPSVRSELKRLDVVVPLFNEIEVVEQLHCRLVAACSKISASVRIVYVDDGSSDGTRNWIRNHVSDDPQIDVSLIELSRNFGQPAAIHAGLQNSLEADCAVLMDGDLQDPPELIPTLFENWNDGFEVVIARRTDRKEKGLRKLAFLGFHWLFQTLSDLKIPANTGTFCLLDRAAVAAICRLPESHRFFPGMRAWVGFKQTMVDFVRPDRAAGQPKQSFRRLVKYALDAIFGYSYKPLRFLTLAGCMVCFASFVIASLFVFKRLAGIEEAELGFTTLACAVFGLGGFQLIAIGVLGEYVGRIYDEVKQRPQYVLRKLESTDRTDTNSIPFSETSTPVRRNAA